MHGFVFNIRRIPVSNSSVLFVRWVIMVRTRSLGSFNHLYISRYNSEKN